VLVSALLALLAAIGGALIRDAFERNRGALGKLSATKPG